MNIKAFDFFCGAGGLTRGLLNSGINVLAGIDNDSRLEKTYQLNNNPSKFVGQDINTIDILQLRKDFGVKKNDLVLYAACAPCQPFSTLNRMEGKDIRKYLLLTFAEKILKVAPPDFLIVENVPGLGNAYGQEVYKQFLNILLECGFKEEHLFRDLLDAKDYGVPQVRKRFILLASRHGKVLPPKKSEKVRTVADAFKKITHLKGDVHKDESLPNHEAKVLMEKHKIIVQAVPKNGGSRIDIKDTSILLECHKRNPKVHKDVFGRMSWDRPSPTLTCRCADVYCGRFVHPEEDRGLSLREAAAIQTFDKNYTFYGTFAHIARQIGNAVPVELANRVGSAIIDSALMTIKNG